jgi:CBS domain-containing protein/DNA-directed RNA polymerase subunit RPC12/RpoP
MERILVADIMTRDPITIGPGATLHDCAKMMVKKRVGSLLIAHKKKLVGFISEKDILWAMIKKSKEDLSKILALDIAPRKIATVNPFISIKEAVKKMKKLKFDRLPVIHNGELVGIITAKDVLEFYPELYSEIDEISKIREEYRKLLRVKKAKIIPRTRDGICEECGKRDILFKVDGRLMCEECRSKI